MNIGLLLSGCGVYDGAEIQEAVLAMLAIQEQGATVTAIGINENQHHVINHLTGEEMPEKRNMMIEAARIARGAVTDITTLDTQNLDALVIPGGFGSAKNFTSWAFKGPEGMIHADVKSLINNMIAQNKPIAALCVSPVVVSKALEGSSQQAIMTIGSDAVPSPYDILAFSNGMEATGVHTTMRTISEIEVDQTLKIVTAPCYMLEVSMVEVKKNIDQAIKTLVSLIG